MNRKTLLFVILPLLITSCASTQLARATIIKEDEPTSSEPRKLDVTFHNLEVKEKYDWHNPIQKAYLKEEDVTTATSYGNGTKELSRPVPLILSTWVEGFIPSNYTFRVSENKDMSDAWIYTSDVSNFDFYNAKRGTRYYWTSSFENEGIEYVSPVSTFETADYGPRNLYIDGITNVRDLGGYDTIYDRRVKQGLIYRTGRLNLSNTSQIKIEITEKGKYDMKERLGVKTEIDLRLDNGENAGIKESPLGTDVNYYHTPMEWTGNIVAKNPEMILRVFNILSEKSSYPVIFHCNIGTDRTGMMAYLIDGLLGVSQRDLDVDYLYSNFGNIGGSRSLSGISEYRNFIQNYEGINLSKKIENYLLHIGVYQNTIDKVKRILLEEK